MRWKDKEGPETHSWTERWLVTRSDTHAEHQQNSLQARRERVEAKLTRLKPKKEESVEAFRLRAEGIVKQANLSEIITVQVQESITQQKRYQGPGHPGPNRAYTLEEIRQLSLTFERDEQTLARCLALAGWRVYATNVPAASLPLSQAIAYYRDEWLVERGFHRFKRGSLPALPLWLRLPERIMGLMLLLLVALQALCLIDFVAHRELITRQETIADLVPGNPKMKTDRPGAERLLARFNNLHLMVRYTNTHIEGVMVEALSPLQQFILDLLGVPKSIYEIQFRTLLAYY